MTGLGNGVDGSEAHGEECAVYDPPGFVRILQHAADGSDHPRADLLLLGRVSAHTEPIPVIDETVEGGFFGNEPYQGLDLPADVLEIIYYRNALRIYPALSRVIKVADGKRR